MLEYRIGNILEADAEALVNTVNCVGIMGRGIALQFKNAFPENFKLYKIACDREELQPGKMFVFETGRFTNPKYIINFPTKRHWRGKSRIEDIEVGLVALKKEIEQRNIRSIAIPPLGSGLGGLNWKDVRRRIEAALSDLRDVQIIVFEPSEAPQKIVSTNRKPPHMTAGRAALVVLMDRYLGGLMDPFVTLLEVHKLMYFLQECGEPLRLRYTKAPFGPYAENLRHVLHEVEGYFVSGYADGGDAPTKKLELVPGAIEDADSFLKDSQETTVHLKKVADLVEGFETPFGLELLSSVHWVASHEKRQKVEDVIEHTYAWNDHKRRFTPRQISIAFDTLKEKGWL